MYTIAKPRAGQVFRLSGVDWETYVRLRNALGDRSGVRMTYDRGELEIMAPSFEHEDFADFLGRMVVILTEEFGLPLRHGGSTTLKRRGKRRGLEPDRCYWIANESKVRGVKRLSLQKYPPPDLALEIDVTRRSLNRMTIYAKLGVREVWRLEGNTLTFFGLQNDGRNSELPKSLSFPKVSPGDLLQFLALCPSHDENAVAAQFRHWLRQVP
jgi:Uma2 family endonuclease